MGDAAQGWVPPSFLLLAILLGGASGYGAGAIANGFLQLVSLLLIFYCLWPSRRPPIQAEARPLLWLGFAFLSVALASLVPLPAELWRQLPGRDTAVRGMELLGMGDLSLPLSLAPQGTLSSLPWLLPPIAGFLLVLLSPHRDRKLLVGTILIACVVSAALGVAQLVSGPGSGLRPYQVTNPGLPVGFFANANHLATLLLCGLPFSGYLAAKAVQWGGGAKRASGMAIAITTALFLVIGIAAVGSVAGYGLLLLIGAATALIYRRAASGSLKPAWVGGVGAIFLLLVGLAWLGPFEDQSVMGDLDSSSASRAEMAATTIVAARDSFPAGTGLGSFVPVYRTFEDPTSVEDEYVNHAHNDYLEIALELGLAGVLLVLAFIAWWLWRSLRVWTSSSEGGDLGRAASIVILAVLIHSVVDYPIRTSAIAVLLATACALMIPPVSRGRHAAEPAADAPEAGNLRHLEAD